MYVLFAIPLTSLVVILAAWLYSLTKAFRFRRDFNDNLDRVLRRNSRGEMIRKLFWRCVDWFMSGICNIHYRD